RLAGRAALPGPAGEGEVAVGVDAGGDRAEGRVLEVDGDDVARCGIDTPEGSVVIDVADEGSARRVDEVHVLLESPDDERSVGGDEDTVHLPRDRELLEVDDAGYLEWKRLITPRL